MKGHGQGKLLICVHLFKRNLIPAIERRVDYGFKAIVFESKDAKPISRITYFDPNLFRFYQKRSSSTLPLDPSSRKTDSSTIDAAEHSMRKKISIWPGMYHSPVANALCDAKTIFERDTIATADTPPRIELTTKTPSMSRTSISYKFSTDHILREQYRNPWNEIRIGKLIEDLDALGGTVSYKHCCNYNNTTRPLVLVTASVDKIVLKKPIRIDIDLTIEGTVTWVGQSSLDIQMEVIQPDQDASDPSNSSALTANFIFVAIDSKTEKSAPINHLSPQTERETLLWNDGEERSKMRKNKRDEQKRDINNKKAKGEIFCGMPFLADRDTTTILQKDTCLQYFLICQPQHKNIHGRMFGGFLMRRALELAYATAYSFAGAAPCFLEVDRVNFLKPVDVGDFLHFKSCVLHTELHDPAKPLINVEVVAHVIQPELRSSEVTNKFYFKFSVTPDAKTKDLRIKNVVPST